jgi:hypothetical protein
MYEARSSVTEDRLEAAEPGLEAKHGPEVTKCLKKMAGAPEEKNKDVSKRFK